MKTEKFSNYSDFLSREDRAANGVSAEFAEAHPKFEEENKSNEACWNCSGCSGCLRCSRCSGCSGLKNAKPVAQAEGKSWFDVPIIPNIHQTILRAVEAPNALDMKNWHTCETTHCRAGWVVTLAGEKGKALEPLTNFGPMLIDAINGPVKRGKRKLPCDVRKRWARERGPRQPASGSREIRQRSVHFLTCPVSGPSATQVSNQRGVGGGF